MSADRKNEYRAHLASTTWAQIRDAAKQSTSGLCAHCGAPVQAVHHVRYPKKFGDDCPQNTIPVCDRCHGLAHGNPPMKKLSVVRRMRELTPIGTEFLYLIAEGVPWGTAESWCAAMRFPAIGLLKTLLFSACRHIENLGQVATAEYESRTVYRWSTMAQAMRAADSAYKAHGFRKHEFNASPAAFDEWMRNYDALFLWGTGLQERALAAEAQSLRTASPAMTVSEAVGQALVAIQAAQEQQGVRLDGIERQLHRDLAEFLTAKQALREKGIDEAVMPLAPEDRRTWSGLLGSILTKKQCARGPSALVRLDGCAIHAEVNTWLRGDAYGGISEIEQSIAKKA